MWAEVVPEYNPMLFASLERVGVSGMRDFLDSSLTIEHFLSKTNLASSHNPKNRLPNLFKTVCNKLFSKYAKFYFFEKLSHYVCPSLRDGNTLKTFLLEYTSLNLVFSWKTF